MGEKNLYQSNQSETSFLLFAQARPDIAYDEHPIKNPIPLSSTLISEGSALS